MKEAAARVARELTVNVWRNARAKPFSYWFVWCAVVGFGLWISPSLERNDTLRAIRYRTSSIIDWLAPRQLKPRVVALIEIGDDEFFGPMHGEHPLSRDYLAKLLRALSFYHPAVIVLDVDLSLDRAADEPPANDPVTIERAKETASLRAAIVEVADHCRVVLPLTLGSPGTQFSGEDLQARLVSWGFLQVPEDIRQVPTAAPAPGPGREILYSLSLSAARAYSADQDMEIGGEDMPYATFMSEAVLQSRVIPAGNVLLNAPKQGTSLSKADCPPAYLHSKATPAQTQVFSLLNGKIAVIGAKIGHRYKGDPNREDMFETPAGEMPGYKVHANYIEALLNERALPAVHEPTMVALELGLTLLLTVVLISSLGDAVKFVFMFLALIVLALVSYLSHIAFGQFAEVLIPAVLVACHFVVDMVLEWRREAHQHAAGTHAGVP
jgi:CHASE2 domain-containing sensor protein